MSTAEPEPRVADERTPFVDRTADVDWLRAHAREAWHRRPHVVVVEGERGIGKTTLVDHLCDGLATDGAQILRAHCREESAVPYLPLVAALRGDGIVPVAENRPVDLFDRVPELFVSFTQELLDTARTRRTVLCVENLQWADGATLDLLSHLLSVATRRNIDDPTTLLVILTTRPPSGSAPARAFMNRFSTEPDHFRLRLGALDEVATNELAEHLLGGRVSRLLLDDIVEITDGNPLFVRTLVRHLLDDDVLTTKNGEFVATGAVTAELADVDVDVARRLSDLSGAARDLLTIAAHLGGDHPVDRLAAVAGAGFDDAFDELESAGLMRERSNGTYRFEDPSMQPVVARSTSHRQRRRIHLRIARRLDELVESPDDPLVLHVAHHLRRAGNAADPAEVFRYAALAVHQSMRLRAWSKVARYATVALTSGADIDDGERIRLELAAAAAHFRNHDPQTAEEACAEALRLAEQRSDLDAEAQALLIRCRSRLTLRADVGADLDDFRDLSEFLDRSAADPRLTDSLRARCWQLLAEVATSAEASDRAFVAADEALRLAETTAGDVLGEALFARGLAAFGRLGIPEARECFERSVRASAEDEWVRAWPAGRLVLTHVMAGQLSDARTAATEAIDLAHRTHHWAEQGLALAGAASTALTAAQLSAAQRAADEAQRLHARSSYPYISVIALPVLAHVPTLRHDRAGALEAVDRWRRSGVRGSARGRLLVDAFTLPVDDFVGTIDPLRYRPAHRNDPHAFAIGAVAVDVEVADRLTTHLARSDGDATVGAAQRSLAELATDIFRGTLERVDDLERRGARLLLPLGVSTSRLRGQSLLGLGRVTEALAVLARAALELRERGAVVEALRCETILVAARARDEPHAVKGSVASLVGELEAHGLLSLLVRLNQLVPELLDDARLRRTVVAWDMIESTRTLVSTGDRGYADLFHELERAIDVRLDEHRGVAFKSTGDGVYAWFLDPADAVRCAIDVRADLRDRRRRHADYPVRLRTGLAVGRPVDDDGDLFGVAVVTAARLCDAATDEQILAACEVLDEAGDVAHRRDLGARSLKGLAQPVPVAEVITAS